MLSVEIRIDVLAIIPHSFIVITGPDGVEQGYGFAPFEPLTANGPGIVRDDTNHRSDVSSGKVEITQDQYVSLMNYINTTRDNPPPYAAFYGSQCSTWIVKALAQMGMIPPFGAPNMQPDNKLVDMVESAVFNPWTQAINIELQKMEAAVARSNGTYRIVYVDPLAVDLDGDGIETVAANGHAGALFDYDGDGIRNATGWIKSDDGLLVRDVNGNETIDDGTELFGDRTAFPGGGIATNGFVALAGVDSDHDGMVDANDANFSQLRVWRDLNQNGISDSGELFTLDQLGIQRLNTVALNVDAITVPGGTQVETGSYTHTDGTVGSMADINFTQDTFHSSYIAQIPVPVELQNLPNVSGAGRLRDLQQAAALSPALVDALALFSAATTSTQRKALLDGVLLEWAKTDPLYTANSVYVHANPYQYYNSDSPNE